MQILISNCQSILWKSNSYSWPDFTFKKLILQSGQKCSYLDFESQLYTKAQTLLQKYYLSQQENICKQDSVCILSGDQYYRRPGQDLTSIGLQLLQNKEGYCLAHGYRYINIGGMYTERKLAVTLILTGQDLMEC